MWNQAVEVIERRLLRLAEIIKDGACGANRRGIVVPKSKAFQRSRPKMSGERFERIIKAKCPSRPESTASFAASRLGYGKWPAHIGRLFWPGGFGGSNASQFVVQACRWNGRRKKSP